MLKPVRRRSAARKDDVIQIRASKEDKAILNRAAALKGKKLSEFVLDVARQRAQDEILDQRLFVLSPEDHEKFLALLDNPPRPTKEMRALFKRKAPWER